MGCWYALNCSCTLPSVHKGRATSLMQTQVAHSRHRRRVVGEMWVILRSLTLVTNSGPGELWWKLGCFKLQAVTSSCPRKKPRAVNAKPVVTLIIMNGYEEQTYLNTWFVIHHYSLFAGYHSNSFPAILVQDSIDTWTEFQLYVQGIGCNHDHSNTKLIQGYHVGSPQYTHHPIYPCACQVFAPQPKNHEDGVLLFVRATENEEPRMHWLMTTYHQINNCSVQQDK